jgi:hypothetical protein
VTVEAVRTTAPGTRRLLWSLWLPLGVRLATMVAQVGVVALLLGPDRRATVSRMYLWDATYYAHIAAIGYPIHVATSPGGGLVRGGTLAFYPLFPELARIVHLAGLSGVAACLVVAWAASAALGPAVAAVVRGHGGSDRTALLAVALLGVLPMSITFQMAYAESTFVLLVVAALLAAQRRRWPLVGLLLLLAGLTRPVGVVAAIGVAGYALATAHAGGRLRAEVTRIAAATVPGLLSGPLFWAFVALRTRMWDAWFVAQGAGWGTHVDLGASVVEFVRVELVHPTQYVGVAVATAATIVGYLAATLWLAFGRSGHPVSRRYVPWLLAGWLLVIGSSNYWHSKPRLLLVDAIIVIPLALALERRGRLVPVTVGVLTVVSLVFGAYMVTGWRYAI